MCQILELCLYLSIYQSRESWEGWFRGDFLIKKNPPWLRIGFSENFSSDTQYTSPFYWTPKEVR